MELVSTIVLGGASVVVGVIAGIGMPMLRSAVKDAREIAAANARLAAEISAMNEQIGLIHAEHIRTRETMERERTAGESSRKDLWKKISEMAEDLAFLKGRANGEH